MYKRRAFILISALLVSAGCASVDRSLMSATNAITAIDPVTGAREINLVSEKQEIQKGANATNQLLAQAKKKNIRLDRQLPEYNQVRRVFNRLRRVVHRPNLPWQIHLIDQKTWNAFTVGGGKLFAFRGLFQGPTALKNDDELAVVIAHEMAHNTARHLGERQGKLLVNNLLDKGSRNSLFSASFSSNQESEADKFSVIYMALAGYNPQAASAVWDRVARYRGSFSANMLHTHPLSRDRAQALRGFARVAQQYYQPGQFNPQAQQLLACNAIVCNRRAPGTANQESGFGALAETLANTYFESQRAKAESKRRQQALAVQSQQAKSLRFINLRLRRNSEGKPIVSGLAENSSPRPFRAGQVRVQYLQNNKMVHQHTIKWPAMRARERRSFTTVLKSGPYNNIRLVPEALQF